MSTLRMLDLAFYISLKNLNIKFVKPPSRALPPSHVVVECSRVTSEKGVAGTALTHRLPAGSIEAPLTLLLLTSNKYHRINHIPSRSQSCPKNPRKENTSRLYIPLSFSFQYNYTNLGTYLQDTGNKVSRRSQIIGTTNIILGGKTVIQAEVIIRGDLLRTNPSSSGEKSSGNTVAVAIGRYCFFSRGCELRPPGKLYKG